MRKSKILECTLRDGSYVIDFQFTASDTMTIGGALDKAGFPYIEVGHGIGLGASLSGKTSAAATDEQYMLAAHQAITHAQWGMFCIPGIATLDHVRCAADHGMHFIRIGTDVDKVSSAKPFIGLARKLELTVFANFMKSYALPPEDFGRLATQAVEYGAELIYLVDSSGGMLPSEVEHYIQATRAESPAIALGFHGHNNLGLAVANSLKCAELGVELIDTSLQGFGRSAGNTPTEQLLSALTRAHHTTDVHPLDAMALGETLIRPLIERRGISSLDVAAGQALFHSSYMPTILRAAKTHQVDPRALIIELCKHDKINAPYALVEALAQDIQETHSAPGELPWENYYGEEQNGS